MRKFRGFAEGNEGTEILSSFALLPSVKIPPVRGTLIGTALLSVPLNGEGEGFRAGAGCFAQARPRMFQARIQRAPGAIQFDESIGRD